jgi:phosphate starvation-inducible PhoH-like protein
VANTPVDIEIEDNAIVAELLGPYNRNIADIERAFQVQVYQRGNQLSISGEPEDIRMATDVFQRLEKRLKQGRNVETGDVNGAIRLARGRPAAPSAPQSEARPAKKITEIQTRKRVIEPRSQTQRDYIGNLVENSLTFGVGPAGTGKTYLAVAAAVSAFLERRVERIVLSRPAVEAGERLGFLPGDMKEKIDPYLRPLYDALHDMLPGETVTKMLENGVFEVAPLAFMRGRTLANAYVVLDEAQNCTSMQMKMFLTRLGENAQMAITGDPSQVDLPRGEKSGLAEAVSLLDGIKGVGIVTFTAEDVVRHPLVARIIQAYDKAAKGDGR